jgi:hypothetical protein
MHCVVAAGGDDVIQIEVVRLDSQSCAHDMSSR